MLAGLAFAGLAFAAAATSLAGCMLASTGGTARSSSCANLPAGACQEQTDRLSAGFGGRARSIDVECRIQACTRALGAGIATITLGDGTRLTQAWSYTGDPNPLPLPTCVGMPFGLCRDQATTAADDQPPSRRIAAVTVTCTSASCTQTEGEISVVFTFADGSQVTTGSGWSSSP